MLPIPVFWESFCSLCDDPWVLSLGVVLYMLKFYLYVCLPTCVSVYHMCVVPMEARKGHLIFWNWSYQSCELPRRCQHQAWSSARAVKSFLICWIISPAHSCIWRQSHVLWPNLTLNSRSSCLNLSKFWESEYCLTMPRFYFCFYCILAGRWPSSLVLLPCLVFLGLPLTCSCFYTIDLMKKSVLKLLKIVGLCISI